MKKICAIILLTLTAQFNYATCEQPSNINIIVDISKSMFKNESVICVEEIFFEKHCTTQIYVLGNSSPITYGRLGKLYKTLKHRCSMLVVISRSNKSYFPSAETIQQLQTTYPHIHTILLIKQNTIIPAIKKILTKINIIEDCLRAVYIGENFNPININTQEEFNQICGKKPQDRKFIEKNYDFLHLENIISIE